MEKEIGKITHFFNRICVAVLDLKKSLHVGDMIHIYGHTTDFVQRVDSLEIDHQKVDAVKAGADVALKLEQEARPGDTVFLVTED